ncbi:hypothetical protein IH879_09280 [candidate division KSB1 bacterium]|nr:hypothetical protein [candidate division KSB1 bacterium]
MIDYVMIELFGINLVGCFAEIRIGKYIGKNHFLVALFFFGGDISIAFLRAFESLLKS